MHRSSLPLALLTALTPFTNAQDLIVNKPAPALHVAKWVKGDKVESFQPGHVYVIEFWATWCGPCIASMPHLSEIQREHQGQVTVIGVTSVDKRGNTLPAVEAMVADKGDGMGYAVAWDDERKTNDAYMKAAGQGGIPCSFLVDGKGQLAYIGHPMFLDIPLAGVLAGTWDPVAGKQKIDAAMKRLNGLAKEIETDTAESSAKVAAFVQEFPMLRGMVDDMQFRVLLGSGKTDKAMAVARGIVDAAIAAKDSARLNEVAWAIVDPQAEIKDRDLALAQRAAESAVALTKEKDGAILDTLARVWFWKKDLKKALELQQKAVALDDRQDLRESLEQYKKALGGTNGQ